MPSFNYRARDNTGKLVRGAIEAATKDEVAEKLRRMGYAPVTITEVIAGLKLEQLGRTFRRISTEDIIMFNIQLANMLNSGLSIMTSLDSLQKQLENKKLKEVIGSVSRSVEGGESFSEALEKHPKVFSHLFVSMVRAGEASGNLDKVLTRYAEYTEAQLDLQQKIRGALFYPAVLIVAATLVIVFIVSSVIPKFVEIFSRAGISLPLPTIILYGTGLAIRRFWYLIILAGVLIVLAIKRYIRTERGRFRFDSVCLKLPIVGPLLRKTSISRFARTLSTLVTSGVPILSSLDIVREVMNNQVLGRVIKQMRDAVERGEKLAESLKVSEEFPPDTVQMISVGEESGNLEGMLNKISDFYDRAIGYSIKKLTTVLEPIFLVVMGAVVAFIMASMLLPMFDMIKVLRR
ncbi:MAG: type II secretion system F family protein [Candidatus Omnitrophica bacterium]|nr:type II secretion system F family protein [Candidatus Omnitrophota bacterium]